MPIPSTRTTLINYCLRRLGAPVLEINVKPEQIEDRIDDALLYFQDFHFDGVEKVFLAHRMTTQDIANKYIPIPPPIISVTRVLPVTAAGQGMGMFDIQYQMRLNDLYTFTSTSVIHYDVMQKHLALLNFEFNVDPGILFTRHQGQLRIMHNWDDVQVGMYYMIECYRILDPDQYPDVYNDRWLKSYATELLRRQWGENMMKFTGTTLLGGLVLNGGEIYQKALDNIEKLEAEVQSTFSLPADFMMG